MSKFQGFEEPTQNWSKLPHQLIDALPAIETIGEMKVIIYTLRHTWGYQDDYKKITLAEFENGRKRKDGSRIDKGTGLTKPTVVDGIKRAVAHGFLFEHIDTSDSARVKKFYSLTEEGLKDLTPDVKRFNTGGKEILHRSEKETIKKETLENMAQSAESVLIQPDDDQITRLNKMQITGQALLDHLKAEQDDDFFANVSEPPQDGEGQQPAKKKLNKKDAAHLLTFGVLPDGEPEAEGSEVYTVRQELRAAGWEIHSLDVELAIVYFVLGVRSQHPGFKIPNDTSSRKRWYSSVNAHLQNYMLAELQDLYKRAIIKMDEKNLSYWVPGSLTNWGLPEVANASPGTSSDYRDDPQYQAFADLY